MEKAGFIQIKSMSFADIFEEMKSMSNVSQSFQKAINMTDEEKEYSFMHRMYVFKKNKKPSEDFSKFAEFDDTFSIVEDENIIYPKHLSAQLQGYHGGLSKEEIKIPIIELSNY